MLRVRFFARIREQLGRRELELPFASDCASVEGLVARLAQELPGCAGVLLDASTIVAVNREVLAQPRLLRDGDEVAFYPPVTGG